MGDSPRLFASVSLYARWENPTCPTYHSALIKIKFKDFPGGPMVKTSLSNAGGMGSILHQVAKMPHASWSKNQDIKQKQYCNKFNKDFFFAMVHIKKLI